MIDAIEVHGIIKGPILGFRRLSQCSMHSPYSGYDPIPDKGSWHSHINCNKKK